MQRTQRIRPGVVAAMVSAVMTLGEIAHAQNDFSGEWGPVRNQDNTENPLVGDWVGIPLSEAGWAYIYRGPTRCGSGATSIR